MKTIAYTEVLYRAAEAAGRTRDALPPAEAAVLKSVFALELPRVWYGEAWNDLTPPLLPMALDSNKSFVNPGGQTDIGDILAIFDNDPTSGNPWLKLPWTRSQDTFTVSAPLERPQYAIPFPMPNTVYVWYLTPCPELLSMTDTDLAALQLPLFLGNHLALRGAGHLLTADGAAQLAGTQFGLAESALAFERTRIKRPVWATPN